MVKRRRMTAKQLKYFGKRRKRVYAVSVPKRKRRYVTMARRRGKGRSYSRGGLLGGGMKSMIAPVLGGIADSYLDPMIPGFDGIGATGVGFILKNETVKSIGLYKLGFSIGNIIPLPGRSGGGSTQGGLL